MAGLSAYWQEAWKDWYLDTGRRKLKAHQPPVRWQPGLCQVLSAMVATTTGLGCFSASRFVPCSPFGPDLWFKLGAALCDLCVCSKEPIPGAPCATQPPAAPQPPLADSKWGTGAPGRSPHDWRNTHQFMPSRPQFPTSSFSASAVRLCYIPESLLRLCSGSAS